MDKKLACAVLELPSSSDAHVDSLDTSWDFKHPSVLLLAEVSCHLEMFGISRYIFIILLPCSHKVHYGIDNNYIGLLLVIE